MKGIKPISATAAMLLATTAGPAFAQVFGEAARVEEEVLGAVAGKQDINQTSVTNNRTNVSNNSIGNNNSTGTIGVDGNAFQNMSGLSILSMNSGNNVAISSAMNVNIAIVPGP